MYDFRHKNTLQIKLSVLIFDYGIHITQNKQKY